MRRRRFLLVTAAMIVAGRAQATMTQWQADALGGTVRIDLRGRRVLSDAVSAGIAAVIEDVEAAVSLFRTDSALSRLNSRGHLADPPRVLTDLVALSDRIHSETDGAFDPTVQPLWRALTEGRDPAPARALIGWGKLGRGDPLTLGYGQALTFNGIAQGYAADRVRALLADAGYSHVLVDMGEFAALDGPFVIGVEDPAEGLVATRPISGTAIATSSPAAMRIGNAFHILGPDGALPRWSMISVEAESAAMADGLSTAFCLMDKDAIGVAMRRLPEVRQVTAVDLKGDVSTF